MSFESFHSRLTTQNWFTTGTITTILAKTCTNTGSWVESAANVRAGHSYTLTLINHDDNHPGDATYTLFDDVTTPH